MAIRAEEIIGFSPFLYRLQAALGLLQVPLSRLPLDTVRTLRTHAELGFRPDAVRAGSPNPGKRFAPILSAFEQGPILVEKVSCRPVTGIRGIFCFREVRLPVSMRIPRCPQPIATMRDRAADLIMRLQNEGCVSSAIQDMVIPSANVGRSGQHAFSKIPVTCG